MIDRMTVIIVGPGGCGKSTLASEIRKFHPDISIFTSSDFTFANREYIADSGPYKDLNLEVRHMYREGK